MGRRVQSTRPEAEGRPKVLGQSGEGVGGDGQVREGGREGEGGGGKGEMGREGGTWEDWGDEGGRCGEV